MTDGTHGRQDSGEIHDPGAAGGPLGGLVKHSVIYTVAPLARQAAAIGMHRLYTGWLAAGGMGVKEVVDFWLIGLQQLLGVNALSAMVRFFYDRKDERERAAVVTSCTLLITLAATVVCGAALVFSEDLAPWALGTKHFPSDEELRVLRLVLLIVPFQLASVSGFYYVQTIKRSDLFTKIQMAKLVFEVTLNFVLMGVLGWGLRGFLISILTGEAVTAFFLCGWIFRKLGMRIDWRVARPILAYALPLIPVGMCQLGLHSVDRRLVVLFDSENVAGVYGHGYKIGYLVTAMLLSPFLQIWHPWVFGVQDPEARARMVARVSTYAALAIGAASLGVILLGRQAAIVLGATRDFWEAYQVIPFIASGYVFWGLYMIAQMPLLIAKRTGRLFVINLLALVVNVGLNVWLIPAWSMLGAAVATLATFVFLSTLCMAASRAEAHVHFEFRRLARVVVLVLLTGAFALWIDSVERAAELGQALAVAVKLLSYPLLVAFLWIGVLDRDERLRFSTWLAARVRRASGRSGRPG